ncbi:vacuolar cation/proton exchanger 2-like [Quercus lobata]|uniref:vacuolar cation/proton exchanger 2-like n=1 Tax=Quercus lobata TaxID=97700 RepID=UPI0012478C74|nr:vacuolar cation/proton exchanger 2-like [Quercus lobata]
MKDKLDITLGVSIGSSTQLCLCPWLDYGASYGLKLSAFRDNLVAALMLQEGTSHYFKGLILLLCYLIVAARFFVHDSSAGGQF